MPLQNLRYAVRRLAHSPGFTAIAVLTLALGIGATTAMFSIVNGVLLKPLPYLRPEELVRVASSGRDGRVMPMSPLDFIDYRDQSHSFAGMAAMDFGNVNLTTPGQQPVRLNQVRVGARFFELLGVHPQAGRAFASGEDAIGAPKLAMLSDPIWRGRFGADRGIIGRSIAIDGKPYTVVGIAPPGFSYPNKADLWVPLSWEKWEIDPENRGAHALLAIGRLAPGATLGGASRELSTIASRLAQQYPESNAEFGANVKPLQQQIIGDVRPALYALLGAVAFVLLIACSNIANLFLVRAAARRLEMAVRTALGAGRSQIVRQLLTESMVISVVGAVLGVLIASWAVGIVVSVAPRGLPRIDEVAIDGRVLAFTVVVTIITACVIGLAPILAASRQDISQLMRESGRGLSRGGAQRARNVLVIAELALAVVLLVGAGLLLRSFAQLTRVDPGFRPAQLVSFDVTLADTKFPFDRDKQRFVDQTLERMQTIPGAQSVAVMSGRPMGRGMMRTTFEIAGRAHSTPNSRLVTAVHTGSADLFRTLGVRLVKGRTFTATEDRPGGPQPMVVNEEFVRRYFVGENPIGHRVELGITHDTAQQGTPVAAAGEIIGVVADVKQLSLADSASAAIYVTASSLPMNDMSVLIRSTADPVLVQREARARMTEIDPDMPVFAMQTMENAVSESVSQPRFYAALLGIFAGVALLLASIGVYGVISYAASLRTRELGIRVALGASGGRVVRLVLAQGLGLTAAGITIGIIAAMWLSRALHSMLFGVAAVDPATYATVAVLLLGVATLASYLPARRAGRVDPAITLRADG